MSGNLDTPVVLVLFARPETLARVFAVVRGARPRRLLLVADGPRPGVPGDVERCRAARAVVDGVDWPCDVRRHLAPGNLGCDARLPSGLDWAFDQVEEAIVLEDDIVPDPSFFPWCAAMLDRYRGDQTVMQVSGRNELGRWGPPGADHLVVRRGSVWGWATWRRAWQGTDRMLRAAGDPATAAALPALAGEPLLAAHLGVHLAAAAAGRLTAWDVTWSLARVLAGGLSVVSPVNLVANVGFGPSATRTKDAGDFRGALRVGRAPLTTGTVGPRPEVDRDYDRWSLLVELMSTYRDPAAARRLARSRALLEDPRLGLAGPAAHHLTPFRAPAEALAVLRQLRAVGTEAEALRKLEAELSVMVGTAGRRAD